MDVSTRLKLIMIGFSLFTLGVILYHCYLKREKKKNFENKYYDVDDHIGDTLVMASGRVLSHCITIEDKAEVKRKREKSKRISSTQPSWMRECQQEDEDPVTAL